MTETSELNNELTEMIAVAEQYDSYFNILNHVKTYGVSDEFLFLCNRNNELGEFLHIELPSYSDASKNLNSADYAKRILAAMEDESEGFFRSIYNFIKNLIVKFFQFFKRLFGFGKTPEVQRGKSTEQEYREQKLREFNEYIYTRKLDSHAVDLKNVVRLEDIREIKRITDDISTRLEMAKSSTFNNVMNSNPVGEYPTWLCATSHVAIALAGYNTLGQSNQSHNTGGNNRGQSNILHFEDIKTSYRVLRSSDVGTYINEARDALYIIGGVLDTLNDYSTVLNDDVSKLSDAIEKNRKVENMNMRELQHAQSVLAVESHALLNIDRILKFVLGFEDLLFKNLDAIAKHFYK